MNVPTPEGDASSPGTNAQQAVKPREGHGSLSPLDLAFQRLLLPVRKSLARIETRLTAPPAESATRNPLSEELADFRREISELLQQNAATPAREPLTLLGDPWQEIMFGDELCADASLDTVRDQFLSDVLSGGLAARALAGQLLLLQATANEELPERLRHVGEAYYRWRPRLTTDDDPLERAMARWLTRRAEAAGLHNSIELVSPGERFDSTRHASTTRGIHVVAVHGWIVLRDNQKVYTKASVTVQ